MDAGSAADEVSGLDDGSIKYRSCVSDRSRVRVLLGIAEKGANAHNKAFGLVLGKTMDELAPTDFYTEHPRSHPRAILLHYKGKNGHRVAWLAALAAGFLQCFI